MLGNSQTLRHSTRHADCGRAESSGGPFRKAGWGWGNLMECNRVRELLPGYLDGALPLGASAETHLTIGKHLELCDECRQDLQSYVDLSSLMSRVDRAAPPADLALRIRVAAAQRLSANPWLHYGRRAHTRGGLILQNILRPLAVPATGGFTVALVIFVLVCQLLGLGAPLHAGSNDSPTNLLQPARLEKRWPHSRLPAWRSPAIQDLTGYWLQPL